ncbi:MAG: hypothetical protein LBV22_02430 [Mycoplasmataceae bacterium]|jgi:UDP-N-acetylmuramyl pentapeptide phosphotransferase/UDP-N-acetylglucosamine-1-phosphate transferase|nr:hypothetical protein [Mycoplasmataceae bacterium]
MGEIKSIKIKQKKSSIVLYGILSLLAGGVLILVAIIIKKEMMPFFILLALGSLLVIFGISSFFMQHFFKTTTATTHMLHRMHELSQNKSLTEAEIDEQISLSEIMEKKTKKKQVHQQKYD